MLRHRRNLPQREPVNFLAGSHEALFERARRGRFSGRWLQLKLCRLRRESLDFHKIIALIRCDAQFTVGLQRLMNVRKKNVRYDAAASMPALGPGIGKQKMKDTHGAGRQQSTHRVGIFQVQDARVSEPGPRDSSTRCAHSSGHPLDAEKIPPEVKRGTFDQECSIAATKIDLERCLSGKNSLDIQRRKIICRENFGICCRMIKKKRNRYCHA